MEGAREGEKKSEKADIQIEGEGRDRKRRTESHSKR